MEWCGDASVFCLWFGKDEWVRHAVFYVEWLRHAAVFHLWLGKGAA